MTNPERFAPLHGAAAATVSDFVARFDVTLRAGLGVDPELERAAPVQSVSSLTPSVPGAAPLTIATTSFPGLLVRFGHWHVAPFPGCGCDACAESLEDELARFTWCVAQLVAGRFRESIRSTFGGRRQLGHEFWSPDGAHSGGERLLEQAESTARQFVVEWAAWPLRQQS